MKKKFDIVGLGSVFVDNIAVLREYPAVSAKAEILKSQKQIGGTVAVALKTLSNFGLKTAFLGKIGNDDNGKFIKDALFTSDISISNIICENKSKSPYTQIWIDSKTGSKTTAYSSGTASLLNCEDFDFEKLPSAKFLHLDGENHDAAVEMAKFYKKRGGYISVDTGSFNKSTVNLLNLADVIIMPKSFVVDFLYEDNIQNLILKVKEYFNRAELIVITDGKNGSACTFGGKIFTQKAFDVDVLDTIGVGAVHAGGILFGLLNNWKIQDTLEFAAASAALKCENGENPTFFDVKNFIKNSRTCKNVEILNQP